MHPGDETMTMNRTILSGVARANFTEELAFEQDLKEAREYVMQIGGEVASPGIGQRQ